MSIRLTTPQVRVLVKVNKGETLHATETRSMSVLERIGYVLQEPDGRCRTTWGGRNYLAGCR